MSNSVSIYYMSGNIFQEIKYNNFDELHDKLKLLINNDSDILTQLLINNDILNNFDNIDMSILSKLNEHNSISIIFNNKNLLYCLGNEDGRYILDHKNDKYSKLLKIIIDFYKDKSYYIIVNSSYKIIVLDAIRIEGYYLGYASMYLQNNYVKNYKKKLLEINKEYALDHVSTYLQNDIDFVLQIVRENKYILEFASTNLQNDKDIVINLQNNKEIVLEAVRQHGLALKFASINLQNDKDIVLTAIRQNGKYLEYASINLQNDKNIVLEAVKQNGLALKFASIDLQNDKDIILAIKIE